MQRVVSELFGCWDETTVQLEASTSTKPLELQSETAPRETVAIQGPVERLALPPARGISTRHNSIYVIAAAVVIVIAISTVIALTATLNKRDGESPAVVERNTVAALTESTTSNKSNEVSTRAGVSNRSHSSAAEPRRDSRSAKRQTDVTEQPQQSQVQANDAPETKSQSIKVVMQIENGRVLNASIANHAAGMDNFEALALRIARQRRYANGKNGNETVTISVNKPDK